MQTLVLYYGCLKLKMHYKIYMSVSFLRDDSLAMKQKLISHVCTFRLP